jgi:hypothetical protein
MLKPTSLCKAYADFYIFSKSTCCLLACFAGLLSLNKYFGGKLIGEMDQLQRKKAGDATRIFQRCSLEFRTPII